MPIDPQTLGVAAAQFMEDLETRHGAHADLASFVLVAVLDAGDATLIEYRFLTAEGNALPVHVCRGILAEVDRGLTRDQ